MVIDKQNGNVAFSENTHTYWNINNNNKYISVTTLIGKFENEFDSDFWSNYKALEKIIGSDKFKLEKPKLLKTKKWEDSLLDLYEINLSDFKACKQEVLDEWDRKNKESCERGTKIHEAIENKFYTGAKNYSLSAYGLGGKFQCQKNYNKLDLNRGVYPEYLVYYEDDDPNEEERIRIAGQIDLLVKDGNDIIIFDNKTNESIDTKSYYDPALKKYTMMKYPLNNLQDCNFYHYSLQLSLYAWMISKVNPSFNIKRLAIIHFEHSGNIKFYEVEYLKDDVERMLKEYKKMIKKENRLLRRKPIDF